MVEGCWLHVEVSGLLQVRLSLESHRPRGELRVHGLWEPLRSHIKVLLRGHGVFVDGRCHWPHGRLQVVLGSKPQGALLARGRFIDRGYTLMGHVKPGPWLDGTFEAHGTRAVKPHRAHLVWWAIEAYRPLLLEAHLSGSRTRSHVVKALNRALKVARSRSLSLKPDWGLLTNWTIKPSRALRVRWTIKSPHTIAASNWTMRHVGAVKPLWHIVKRWSTTLKSTRTLVVRPIKTG